eukprot:3359783-Amphidinium_carterae.2
MSLCFGCAKKGVFGRFLSLQEFCNVIGSVLPLQLPSAAMLSHTMPRRTGASSSTRQRSENSQRVSWAGTAALGEAPLAAQAPRLKESFSGSAGSGPKIYYLEEEVPPIQDDSQLGGEQWPLDGQAHPLQERLKFS